MPAPFFNAPEPPYWAVIFTSVLSDRDTDGYDQTHDRMLELAVAQPGYLGLESVRGEDGFGIVIIYYDSEEAVRAWGRHAEHRQAQKGGREVWYRGYRLRVARVERHSQHDNPLDEGWSGS